jgi:hypothetical protein
MRISGFNFTKWKSDYLVFKPAKKLFGNYFFNKIHLQKFSKCYLITTFLSSLFKLSIQLLDVGAPQLEGLVDVLVEDQILQTDHDHRQNDGDLQRVVLGKLQDRRQREDEFCRARVEDEGPATEDVEDDQHRGGSHPDVVHDWALAVFFGQRVDDLTNIPARPAVGRVHQLEDEGEAGGIEGNVDKEVDNLK